MALGVENFRGKVVRAIRVGDGETGRLIGNSLRALREFSGFTQEVMARRLRVGQTSISKIENGGNVNIQTLQKYVECLGAKLRIEASIPGTHKLVEQLGISFERNDSEDTQLVFPIFGDDPSPLQRDIVISIRPQYTEKIIEGKKTVELRRRFPVAARNGTIAYLYSTSPVRAIVGRVEIINVEKLPVSAIWRKYQSSAFITKADFDRYFHGVKEGYALEFTKVQALPRQLSLDELRERFDFEPPQSFLYMTAKLNKAMRNEFSNVSY